MAGEVMKRKGELKDVYLVTHKRFDNERDRFVFSEYYVKSKHVPSQTTVIKFCGIEFHPEWLETIEICRVVDLSQIIDVDN